MSFKKLVQKESKEKDPVFLNSEAALFESGDKALLDSALQSFTESDPVYSGDKSNIAFINTILTNARIPFADSNHQLVDSANLKWDNANNRFYVIGNTEFGGGNNSFDFKRKASITNLILTGARLFTETSGTPAPGIGSAFSLRAQGLGGTGRSIGYYGGNLINVGAGTEIGEMVIAPDWQNSAAINLARTIKIRAIDANTAYLILPQDKAKILLGAGEDATIHYDGTNLVINPKEVGSGYLSILGDVVATGTGTFGAVQLPDYTTIASPAEGMIGYDFTNHYPVHYDGANWVQV